MKPIEKFYKAKRLARDKLDEEGYNHSWRVYKLVEMTETSTMAMDIAALLHDIVEDSDVTEEEIREEFGDEIADLVMEVTHEGEKDSYGYYFPRLKTKQGIAIKFADRLDNLTRKSDWEEDRQQHYLKRCVFWKDGSDKKYYD